MNYIIQYLVFYVVSIGIIIVNIIFSLITIDIPTNYNQETKAYMTMVNSINDFIVMIYIGSWFKERLNYRIQINCWKKNGKFQVRTA